LKRKQYKIIALKSEGSARDATGLLDQASSYIHNVNQNDIITAESVNRMLGLVQVSTILKLVRLIIGGNAKEALKLLEEIYINSSNLEYFVEQTADFIAALTKEKLIPGFHEPLYKNYGKEMTDILVEISLSRLSILWQIFSSGTNQIKSSHNELITAEMLIIKAIYSCNIPDIEQLLDTSNQMAEPNLEETVTASNRATGTSRNIFDFLKFCHAQNEMELYYVLLNEVEIKNFTESLIEIAANTKIAQEKNLKSMLRKWSGTEWNVVISKQDKINSLKQELLKKVKESEDFTVIKNNFPNADVSDIILKS